LQEKNKRMRDMGVPDIDNPVLGETYIELNEHYVMLWDEEQKKFVLHLVTVADNEILLRKPLKEILGIDFYPLISWATDVERTDIWSDGEGDIVRTPNKILNAWLSQLVENRTLRNFGMNYYNSSLEGFVPQTFEPVPWGWYPIPAGEKPIEQVVKRVEIPDLSESLDEMVWLIQLVERATAATASQKGTSEKNQITLGEVQILLKEVMDRIDDIQEMYDLSWKEFGEKWYKLIEANTDSLEAVKLHKKSYKGNYFEAEVKPSDWKSEAGYTVIVRSSDEQEEDQLQDIQKLLAIRAQFPQNVPLARIVQKKLLDLAKVSPEEAKEVLDFENQRFQSILNPSGELRGASATPTGQSIGRTPIPAALPAPAVATPAANA
jgi:hypothetical protein